MFKTYLLLSIERGGLGISSWNKCSENTHEMAGEHAGRPRPFSKPWFWGLGSWLWIRLSDWNPAIKHCEKGLPLKCHSFRERSNFPRIWFRDLRFRTWGLEINHLNARLTRVFFLSLLSRKFDDRLSSNFHMFVILCIMLRYANCEG